MSSRPSTPATTGVPSTPIAVLAWLWVLVPFGYGLYNLVIRAQTLFS